MQLCRRGVRCRDAQVRLSPVTGREELVVLGGLTIMGLASMEPLALDLMQFDWRHWHAHRPCPGRAHDGAAEPSVVVHRSHSGHLPSPRQRAAAVRVSRRWLLVVGGSSGEVREALEESAIQFCLE